MEVISAQFAQQGAALKGFDKLLATYRQRRHEADAGMATAAAGADAAAGGSPSPSPSSVIASQLGLVGLGMLPGVGAFTGAVDPNQVAAGADRVKALLSTRLRSHGDVELVLSPLDALTPVFLEELGEVARKHPWIVLFFDTYERTGPMLDTWLRDVLGSDRVLGRYDEALADLAEAADLDCGNAWTHYETAVVLHALGHPDRDRHLARVLELTPNGAPAEGGSAADIGNLVLAHCVWPRWEQAGQHLAEFLAEVPPPGQMHELLVALRSLIPVIPSAESRIEELCRAVEGRLDVPS
ncbi:hypothetical protein [Streptomyces sp. NPDC049949]|uniref:hypothetical protein n=1 Tax=Streptomyces sp. NPDC049949 TaxID=3154627 RepID=UPI0034337682